MRLNRILGLVLTAVTALAASGAQAAPITLTADPSSNFSLGIAAGSSSSGQITGSMNTDIDLTPTITDGTGSFSVANFSITGLLLGTLTIQNFHLTVTNPGSVTGTGSNPYNVDIAGAVVSVDGGQVVLGGSTLFNFNTSPTVVTAPPGSNSTLTLGASSTTWSIPFTTVSTLSTLGIPVNITIGTQLNLTGPAVVPEPGTVMLVGAGLVGLVAAGRRKKA
jgi:hypothetical protein